MPKEWLLESRFDGSDDIFGIEEVLLIIGNITSRLKI